MVSVGSSLFEISGLWFQLFAILPLAILSKISLLVASLFTCVVSGVDGMDSIRRMVLDAIERIVNPSDSRARNKKTTKKGKRIGKSGKRAGGGKNGGSTTRTTTGRFLPTRPSYPRGSNTRATETWSYSCENTNDTSILKTR